MKKILFPTAYNPHSKVAFRYAQKLVQYFEASITLVHIYESPTTSLTSTGGLVSESIKRFSAQQANKEMDGSLTKTLSEDIQIPLVILK